ncbi:hypothetical protein [Nocardia goodfellowii]|uniref:Uncharacterized protein n=1 Tax=Nocardia goodfellowii TaxID=882446 RepID=A0ABS4QJZ7_9NOCA|nr:hypothetical protein [Nocardia goodfellowii]MBP2192021.1 hypothetical protein [Nocardia goodfellowii]
MTARPRRHQWYRMAVFAPSALEVVRCAGGWICDRAMAGWDVTIVTAPADSRPLRILGAHALDPELDPSAVLREFAPQAIAVAGDLFEADARIRDCALGQLACAPMEITVWGASCPPELGARMRTMEYRLSYAARAFKARAWAAVALPDTPIAAVESCYRDESTGRPPGITLR